MMATLMTPQGSAKIYQFPVRPRATGTTHREDFKPAMDSKSQRVAAAAIGSGWYHEAAIEESKGTREH